MGYQVLARKWRPGKFSELVGQEHVVRAISNALDNNRLHHAYLFTGTRGVGKTTIARIFSRSLNCETGVSSNPCGVCPACLDIEKGSYVDLIEIDAASRTKVEDTREILDNVQYRPSRGEYKVYLIDEVHMLSKNSFNALLKTLEEPPPHIKFLLATTDPQKLPITILSRCLQFNLKALTREQIGGQLSHILQAENIAFENKALELLARSAHGSMRDALSLTDQAIAQGNGQVMSDVVSEMLGLIDADQISNLVSAIFEKDKSRVLELSAELALLGTDFKAALAELISVFHQIALTQFVPEACKLESTQARKVYGWARAITPELVQLYYQIALQGRKDIEWAQDLKVGFEMTIMRMMAFTPEAIKTDISDLQVAAKLANQEHNEQFISPPPSLLSHDNGEKQNQQVAPQTEPEQKKNVVDHESDPLDDEAVSLQNGVQQIDSDGTSGADLITQHQGSDPHLIESAEGVSSDVESVEVDAFTEEEVSADAEDDKQQQTLATEMDALIQEAQELRSTAFDKEQAQSESSQPDPQSIVNDAPVASEPELSGEQVQTEPQPIENAVSEVSDIDHYADYDSLQQASEQDYSELNSYDAMAHSSDGEGDQSGHASVHQEEPKVPATSGSTANTHELLNLMQTLNQATTGDDDKQSEPKTASTESLDSVPLSDNTVSSHSNTVAGEDQEVSGGSVLDESSESRDETANVSFETSDKVPFHIEPVEEELPQASSLTNGRETQSQAPADTQQESYSDDLYQADTQPKQENVPHLPDASDDSKGAYQAPEPEPDDGFFSPQQMLSSQQDDAPPWDTSASAAQQQGHQVSEASAIPDTSHAEDDYFAPGASYGHQDMAVNQNRSNGADYGGPLPDDTQLPEDVQLPTTFLPQSDMEGTEEEWQATDIEMSVDFEIPFAVDGKKVTKASQLDTWSQLIERAGLGGLTKQLALNSNYFNDGEHIKLVVSRTQNHLMSENVIKTIEESISNAIQQPVKLQASMGEVIDTPAAVQKAINEMRQQHAVKTIQQDSAVADICHSFSGTVLQDTIKPR